MLQAPNTLYLAILAQVLLTLVVYILLGAAKAKAYKAGSVDRSRVALHADAWPEPVQKLNNNIRNQLEVPVLFYVVCFVLAAVGSTGVLVQVLAWLFVASRIVHAWIHTGSNFVPLRRNAFLAGVLVLLVLWVIAAFSVL
jgi:hypothetical protein